MPRQIGWLLVALLVIVTCVVTHVPRLVTMVHWRSPAHHALGVVADLRPTPRGLQQVIIRADGHEFNVADADSTLNARLASQAGPGAPVLVDYDEGFTAFVSGSDTTQVTNRDVRLLNVGPALN